MKAQKDKPQEALPEIFPEAAQDRQEPPIFKEIRDAVWEKARTAPLDSEGFDTALRALQSKGRQKLLKEEGLDPERRKAILAYERNLMGSPILYDAPAAKTGRELAKPETAMMPAAAPADEDVQMGQQLTEQYRIAEPGLRVTLMVGAMIKQVRARLAANEKGSAARGGTSRHDPRQKGEAGIEGWLAKYAPEVSPPTSRRFEKIFDAVEASFCELSAPARAKAGGFAAFVLTPPEELPEKLRAKQMELWDFVQGKSQRSFLDKLKDPAPKGGLRVKGQRNGILPGEPGNELPEPAGPEPEPDYPGVIPPEQARPDNAHYAEFREPKILEAIDHMLPIVEGLEKMLAKGWWLHLPPKYLDRLKGTLIDANRAVKHTKN